MSLLARARGRDRGRRPDLPAADGEPWFTPETLASHLQVSERTVRNWVRQGRLPSYKIGRSRRFDPADVERFLARCRE